MEKLLIIDSNSIMNRAFFGMPRMVTTEGLNTNAVLGYINILNKIREELKPDFTAAVFDMPGGSFRNTEYAEYKGTRKGMSDELAEQMPVIKDVLSAMAISIFGIPGFEADDLIGTISLEAEKEGIECYILSGDKDTLQLASKMTKVVITKRGVSDKVIYNDDDFFEEFGVTPTQFIDVKGLMGDKSDNIPGVPGVGEKTAFSLIQEYGSIENLYENIGDITRKKLKENLVEHYEDAVMSRRLATIKRDVPMEIDFEEIKSMENYDEKKLRELYLKLQFRQLLNKLGPSDTPQSELKPDSAGVEIYNVDTENLPPEPSVADNIIWTDVITGKDADKLLSEISKDDNILLSFTYKEDPMLSKREIEYIYLSSGDNNYVIDFNKVTESGEGISALKKIFEDRGFKKLGYNIKNAYTIMKKKGIEFTHVDFDVLLAVYLLEPGRGQYSLKDLITTYLYKETEGTGHQYKILETRYIDDLTEVLEKMTDEAELRELLFEVEMPLTNILSDMELTGMKVDVGVLKSMEEKFRKEIEETTKVIHELAGEEFNISSPKQLGVILFDKLKLPPQKKTKTGYSTNQEVLDALKEKHPIIEKILYYRQITKIYSTYVEGLMAAVDEDGAIHSNFQQTLAVTGRLSSTEPNLQNIPIRVEMGRELRKAFIPLDEDSIILSSDYSQIELRVLAHMAADENMLEAFREGTDIHTKTASEVMGKDPKEVTPQDRSSAKAVNFGIVYGIGDFALSQDLGITRKEAREYIDRYYDRYPGIRTYFDRTINEVKETGTARTIMNRRRQIPEIASTNKMVQALGVRLAMNSPIQGSAADIIKLAMVKVYNALKEEGLESKIILQVHDEIIINMKKNEEDRVRKLVEREMSSALNLLVDLKSDQNTGENWYEAK